MPVVEIKGLKALSKLAKLGNDIQSGNKSVLRAGKDSSFKTLVGNITRIDTSSMMSSAEQKDIPNGFFIGFGKGKNSKTGKQIKNYSIPQELGFTHYRSGKKIPAMNAVKKTLDANGDRIINDLNTIVSNAIKKALHDKS